MNKELELEYKLSCRNPFVGQIYDWCIQCKKEILVTSDMYLPQELIERILEKNNYKELKKLYLSSSIGKGNLQEIYLMKYIIKKIAGHQKLYILVMLKKGII